MSSPSTFIPSRAGLRKLLNAVLIADSDLEAFCLDYFPDVMKRFAANMDRVSKVTILLEQNLNKTQNVLAQLRRFRAAAVAENEHLLHEDSPRVREEKARSERLEQLLAQKEHDTSAGKDTTDLQLQINDVRREMRRFPQLNEGEILDDRYRLTRRVGHGGFGDVWQAYDRKTEDEVAIKVLHSQHNNDQSRVDRFKYGALKMSRLRHRHIVGILKDPDIYENFHYFVMEYFSKGDLHKAICDKIINSVQATRIILQAAEALSYAHQEKLIHRDVKPHNILLTSDLEAKIIDFDLVYDKDFTGGTRTGSGMGTFLYASPEQLEDATKIDHRTDIYSLGRCLAFVVHGKPLSELIFQESEAFLQKLDCSEQLKKVIRKATDRKPEKRHPTMDAFCQELRQATNLGSPSSSLAPPRNDTRRSFLARFRSRRPSLAAILGTGALSVVISVGGGLLLTNLAVRPTPPDIEKIGVSPATPPKPIPSTQGEPTATAHNAAPTEITPASPPKTEAQPPKPAEAATPAATTPAQPNPQAARRNWINGRPPAPPIERGVAFAKLQEGKQQIDIGRLDLGYQQCYAATGNLQTRGLAISCMGEAEFGRGRYNEALKLGKFALKEKGPGRDTYLLLGKTYLKLKNCKEARPFFLRVLNSSSGNPEALAGLDKCPP